MKLNIRAEKNEITEAMKLYAEEKLLKLEKYVKDEDALANVLFKVRGPKQKIEVTIPLKGVTLRVEEEGQDFYAIIDTTLDKLERQIRKNKTRLERAKTIELNKFDFSDFNEEIEEEKIIKRKKIEVKPMDEEEAILQMELLGHDFFFFKNIDTDKTAVLYKRKDGAYGIIDEQ